MKPRDPIDRSNVKMDELSAPLQVACAPKCAPRISSNEAIGIETELLERARKRDHEAFRMLVDRHRDHAFGLALRITRSREDAEDAAQEAFVRAWLALPGFRGESSFGTWLHRIVARKAMDHASTRRQRAAREVEIEGVIGDCGAPAGAGRDVVLERRIERLMACLSVRQRAVVALFYREDRSVLEIAAMLGMPENTVKTHLRRARAALRDAWLRDQGAIS